METRVREGRTALAITVLLIVTLTVPTILVGGTFGFAEAQQSPSPTGTAPTIELVNPSDYEGTPVLSDKDNNPGNDSSGDDPADEQYHFNAWTRNAPNNATVEFFIVQGSNQISLGFGTNRGGGVYDLFSGIPNNLNDAAADVRVILYSGGEIDRDEQAVVINQQTETATDETVLMQREYRATNAAETVEIEYPQNTGGVGFFGRPGQPKAANVEVTHSRTGTAGSSPSQGGGPENIRAYYTLSHRGTDPEWKACGTETQSNSADGVRCELAGGDQPEWVTGIAAVTIDTEAAPNTPQNVDTDPAPNSGDAHVAVGYTQVPSSVLVASPSGSQPVPGCSPLIPVTVADQIGREITGAPVDVHAQGPADSLAFVTERDETGANNNEPDDNDPPENHSTEQGRKCDGSLSDELQGEHEEAGALPDRKHTESTHGTDGDGQFIFKLWNNVPGGTTITAYVDMDDNDRFCATEASGNGIINWGTGGPNAPQPGGPEDQTCAASPSPSPSASASPSPTQSATASASPSASPTGSVSPSPSGSPSPSASASPSASLSTTPSGTASPTGTGTGTTASSPQQSAVEVTIETSQPRKTFGRSFTLTGSVTSDNPACSDLITVEIHRDVVGGEDDFALFAQETTDANGAYSVTDRADRSASYIARVAETASCDSATSDPQPVLVRTKVNLSLSRDNVEKGQKVRFTIRTAPCPLTARDRVLLFRAIDGEFGKSGRKQTNGRCVAAIVRRVNQSSVYQARWPKQTPELLAGRSRSKAVRVTD